MPSNTAAWLRSLTTPLDIAEAPYTSPGPNELTVKNSAVAVNPVDWTMQDKGIFVTGFPLVLGSDVAGTVVEVGAGVTDFKPGDRVVGHALALLTPTEVLPGHEWDAMSNTPQYGAFQQYSVMSTSMVGHLPANVSFEEGSVLPMGINTAAAGLFQKGFLELDLPKVGTKPNGKTVFVWGGSSSVGSNAIQLAKGAGYEVFATASKRNHQFCKDIGAAQVFDYNDPDIVNNVAEALKGKNVAGAYDAISHDSTVKAIADILKKAGGVQKISTVLPTTEGLTGDVTILKLVAPSVRLNKVGPAMWHDYVPQALEAGELQPKPDPKVVGKGLESIQLALDTHKAGLSASKIVVSL